MYLKQKVNAASQISARGTLVITRCFQNRRTEFEAYFNADNEGKAVEFLKTQTPWMSPDLSERLAQYYEINSQLMMMGIDRTAELLTWGFSNTKGFNRACNAGIVAEYEWIKAELEDNQNPNKATILRLYQIEIDFLKEHADLIISLDSDFSIQREFGEISPNKPTQEIVVERMTTLLAEQKMLSLGRLILQNIQPTKEGRLFTFKEDFCRHLTIKFMTYIRGFVQLDPIRTHSEKREILGNQNNFLQFLVEQGEDYHIACVALLLDSLPAEERQSPIRASRYWRLGESYKRLSLLGDKDYEVLIQLFEETSACFSELSEEATGTPQADLYLIKTLMHTSLGEFYDYFWEWQQAFYQYQQSALTAYSFGEKVDFEGGLSKMIDGLQQASKKEDALKLCWNFLRGRFEIIGIEGDYCLASVTRKKIEFILLELLYELKPPTDIFEKYLSVIESETFLVFQKMIEDFQANDEISIEKMQLMQDFFEKYHQQLAKHYGLEMLEEDKFRQVLQALRLNEGDAKIYRQKLETILPYLEKQTLDWQLTYRLHEAKLKYLENDATCVDDYWHLLPRMEDYNLFGEGEKYYWILSFIRSAVLQINIEEELVSKIGLMVEKAIHLKTQDYLKDYYNQRSPNFVLQDFDLLFGALIENIERIENRKIQQILLRLLWNAIVYQQKFINFFGAKTIVKVYDEQQFLELKQQLKACLVELHLFNKHQLKDKANEISRKINQLEHHWIKKTQKFCHQQNPENRSILFHFFTRQYGQKALLMLSFNQSYKWQVIRDFDKHEELLADFKQKKAASIKEIGWLALIQETVTFRNFGKPLAFFFNQYWEDRRLQKMAQLFGNHQETIEKAPRIDLYLDNLLFLFPFEQLPYQASEKLIGHQFSLNKVLLKNCKTKEVRPEKGIVIFAGIPPVGEILALEHTLTEGNLIQKIFAAEGYAARLFSGMAANITNLNQQMQTAQKPSIIHFGTHGIASADLAAETCALVLAPLPDRLSTALLTYEDIVRSNFRGADLVVLSACDSSIGKMQKSSPVQGLAYAFLSAGAEFVLASRIPTRDEQTQLFMRVFYDYLLKTDIANALRLTRIYFFEKTSIVTDEDITAWCLYS